MSQTKIKVCGFRDSATLIHAFKQDASESLSYFGLNLIERSPRYVTPEQANSILRDIHLAGVLEFCEPVFLFANHSADHIAKVMEGMYPGRSCWTVQLHGDESPDFVESLPPYLDVIKAVPFDEATINRWRGNNRIAGLMVDAPKAEGELSGGTGRTFDWQRLANLDKTGLPNWLFLAGGLTPDNVDEAIRTVRPYAVDVSSGVESSRGVKDVGLIKAFCEAVRQADTELD